MAELLKDYISLFGSVKEVFHERFKTYKVWKEAEVTLTKKRENKAKLELAGKSNKVPQAQSGQKRLRKERKILKSFHRQYGKNGKI